MEEKIIKIFNKIFICLKKTKLSTFSDLSNTKILYQIGLELNKEIFSSLENIITGKEDLKIRISELNEISEAFLTILKSSKFIPTEKFKQEIELIDIIGLANKENKTIYNFALIILITIFYSSKINLLNEEEISTINTLINPYVILNKEINGQQNDYKIKIEKLENDLKIEKERSEKIKLFEEQYSNQKKKITNMEIKNANLLKELIEAKNKIKSLEKIIEEKNNKMGILQNKLDEKIKLIKERDIQLNKEIESNMELKFKLDELTSNDNKNIMEINNDNKYKEIMKLNEDLKIENSQLNEIIKVMEKNMEEKNFDEKEREEIKNRYEKEFELMSSAIYNLGFQFWSLKLEDSEKLKQNENWLIRERIKQYNGDY